jgi:hypothetical protein
MGWIVSKWMNTVEQEKNGGIWKLVSAKRKYNPFAKVMTIGTGFPDFVCFRRTTNDFFPIPAIQQEVEFEKPNSDGNYDVIGLEVKGNGYLDKTEKSMCIWLLENKIFSKMLIARRGKKVGEIEYIDFKKKYNNKE